MQSSSSYEGNCCVCVNTWTHGLAGIIVPIHPSSRLPHQPLTHLGTQCCFGGYRKFLSMGSRGRLPNVRSGGHTYQFGHAEQLPTPAPRTLDFVIESLRCVEALGLPFAGHKSAPMPAQWPGFDWFRYNGPELCHGKFTLTLSSHTHAHSRCVDSKIFVEMLLKVLVGKGDQGMYTAWSEAKDAKHRREAQMLGIYPDIWPRRNGPLPYRLTRAQIKVLDDRMGLLLWPHYVERLFYDGHSFWTHPSRMWKMRRKLRLLYYILPTQLRDQVPAVRHALYTFVWAMRRLEGCDKLLCLNKYLFITYTHTYRSSTLMEHVQKTGSIAGFVLC